jgi:predicted RNA-binding Zn-ribbon protein involved in translation (DUF1610 family)
MEAGKKKMIMIVIIVACIVAAVIITVATRSASSGGIESIPTGTMVWLKCRDCGNTWQMDRRDYYDYIEKNRIGMTVPGIVCPKCGKESAYLAIKCPKCGNIFEKVATTRDYSDRCPECGYSEQEELRKKASGGRQQQPTTETQQE